MTIPLLDRIPIRRKLRLVILTTSMAALCIMAGALFALHYFAFTHDYKARLVSDAEVVAALCADAINSKRAGSVGPILATLRAKPQITGAFVRLRKEGMVEAEFGAIHPSLKKASLPVGFAEHGRDLIYVHPLIHADHRFATLTLISNFGHESAQIHGLYASVILTVLGIAFLLAMLIASRLERVIADPIDHLAETARRIGARNDYSIRARKIANDELGECTDSFNLMLDRIQNRDSALRYEIAERARAEQELQRAHQHFIEASRQEGMADVATCVLHNVGNVLNSVNVSATLITENLSLAHTENLVKAAGLLKNQDGPLEEFLTRDPKGRLLPGYLSDLSEQIFLERGVAQAELELLLKNIDHIKEIVSMQQRYARGFGVVQMVAVNDLVEDALRMNANTLELHHISVVRDFQPVPVIQVDKHKVLQIIVNLIRNARDALDDAAPLKKRLTLTIQPRQLAAFVEISVDDNGIGISEKNLARLFGHGFTTRTDGHGFGLHNGAVAAKQMGGTLTAESEGHLRGAVFRLTLPIHPPQAT